MRMTAHIENTKTLASVLGIDENEAEALLEASILITYDAGEETSKLLASELELLLQRTVFSVANDILSVSKPDVEVVIGLSSPRADTKRLFIDISRDQVIISETNQQVAPNGNWHPACLLIGACYAAAKTLACYLGERFPYCVDEPLVLDFQGMFAENLSSLHEPVDIGTLFLAGAGAVGNAFIYGLRYFDVQGTIHVVDPKLVKEGNLNRCMFFDFNDLGLQKADRLCKNAQSHFKSVNLIASNHDLREHPERGAGQWLKRLVVTVDSRRVRRNLQSEIPGEVYDASTTGIQEVVLHFNKQPSKDKACLSCIYVEEEGELTHEQHVAELLGVEVAKVHTSFIDNDAANVICMRYPEINPETIVGTAYDSLFKQLCGQGKLQTSADKHVLAPFAFVSVLAGAMLAIELVTRIRNGKVIEPFNYWRLSPYSTPVIRGRRIRNKIDNCEFCDNNILEGAAKKLWGDSAITEQPTEGEFKAFPV